MRRLILVSATLTLLAAATGCGEKGKTPQPAPPQQAYGKTEVAEEAGMCREHGVLEALCTKCNPKLAPVFQAKGDWCAEHGFPESVCPTCHPERGGKPAVDVAGDDAPADGTKVLLKTKETERLAGIETTKAVPGKGTAAIVAPAVIAYDATRMAQVNARSSGVVRRVSADIGAWVAAGSPLAVIESAAVGTDQSKLAVARSRAQMMETNYRRKVDLEKKGISAKKEVLAAEQEYREAVAEVEALQASLRGVGPAAGSGRYTLKAPVSGVVTQRNVSVDRYVDPQMTLFEIVDTSSMWAEVAVREADLGAVKIGSSVTLTFDAISGRDFKGTISNLASVIDPQTRTVKARVRLANTNGLLRANMYGQARIQAGGERSSSAVPRGAVQRAKSVNVAFVRVAPAEYETRRVQLAETRGSNGMVDIASGIEVGEEVVVAGSFFLKTETLRDSIGAGCCEVESK
ncbi:efflux RND transporter periplasmic adaptor subunit [Geobacter sp. DSM 9736]|uniref:efflux RND transporter periplasmic adaptor subunit n=1 Tax=Geobacter sp. DSM 9736 TaxID=1277350 RepID=UPI000B5077BE|nr:efflux RND transporter periplasmic adaptor subunit [Geobacter sp. DSM 9736]SNB44773.1 membrane fusion protein, cobalt-zinc-cadmium efflux system [Geobacter sp. DSM 9736]